MNGNKNKKTKFCRIFIPWSGSLAVAYKRHHCNNFYGLFFIRLTLFFRHSLGLKSMHNFVEFISMFNKEIGRILFVTLRDNGCQEEKNGLLVTRKKLQLLYTKMHIFHFPEIQCLFGTSKINNF